MKRLLLAISVLFASAIYQNPASAQVELAAGMAVNSIVDNLRTSLQKVIKDAQSSFDQSSFSTYTQASLLLQNVNIVGNELVGKTFGELNEAQRRFFMNTLTVIEATRKGSKDISKEIRAATASLDAALGTIP